MKKGFTPPEKAADQALGLAGNVFSNGTGERSFLTGFTLLETMVVVAIVSFIFAALMMVMSSGRTSWSEADSQIALQQDLRRAISEIAKDLGQSGQTQQSCLANNATYTSISFNRSSGVFANGTINWSTSPITVFLSGNQVNETQGGNWSILANNVTSLTFTRRSDSPRLIRVNMTTSRMTTFGRAVNATMAASVFLRN